MFINVIFLLVIIFLLLYLDCRKPKGYPPGPRWWPILGCVLEIARIRREVKYFSKICSKFYDKYGPIVGLKIGINRIVVFNDLCSIRAMLLNKDCDGRPTGMIYDARNTSSAWQGMFVKDKQQSAVQRRFIMRYFQEFHRTNMGALVEDEAQKLLEHLKELQDVGKCPKINNNNINNNNQIYKLQKDVLDKCDKFSVGEDKTRKHKLGTTVDFYSKTEEYGEVNKVCESKEMIIEMVKIFELSNLNTIWRIIVGKRLEINDKQFAHLYRIIKQALPDNIFSSFFNHYPILRFIIPETSDHKSYIKGFKELLKSLIKELHHCKKTLDPDAPRGLMDAYLIALSSGEVSDSLNESQLIAICKELFLAVNTTSNSLAFGFLYMILYPQIQEKAQEEIDRVVGRDRFPTLADKSKMPYIQAVVLESVRIFANCAVNIPHKALKDTTILGYNIPKDTLLLVNFGAISRDHQNDSEKFRPERFFDSDGNIVVPDNYIYFSLGKHHCIGEMFAKNHMFIIISTLLQKFNFSVVPGEPQPSTEDFIDNALPSPKSFKALVSLRT